jgi:hypothetical protein
MPARKKKEEEAATAEPAAGQPATPVSDTNGNAGAVQVAPPPADVEVPPEPVNGTKPVETFSVSCGGGAYVQCSIWGKQIEYEGRTITVYSVTVRKSYKDQSGEWKNMHSFRGSELYCLHHVLHCANQWILNARTTASSECPF